jgi:hypothetical protein
MDLFFTNGIRLYERNPLFRFVDLGGCNALDLNEI